MRISQIVFAVSTVSFCFGCCNRETAVVKGDSNEWRLLVKANGDVELDGSSIDIDQLGKAVRKRLASTADLAEKGQKPSVSVAAQPETKVGDLRRAVEICHEFGIEQFVLHVGQEDYPFVLGRKEDPYECSAPPFQVRLVADYSGAMSRIEVVDYSDKVKCTDLNDLQHHARAYVGDERGPGSIAEDAFCFLDCDAKLQVKYLQQVFEAVSYYMEPTSLKTRLKDPTNVKRRVKLFRNHNISLFPYAESHAEGEGEEPKLENLPGLDVGFEPLKPEHGSSLESESRAH